MSKQFFITFPTKTQREEDGSYDNTMMRVVVNDLSAWRPAPEPGVSVVRLKSGLEFRTYISVEAIDRWVTEATQESVFPGSAYEAAVQQGYEGTPEEWLAELEKSSKLSTEDHKKLSVGEHYAAAAAHPDAIVLKPRFGAFIPEAPEGELLHLEALPLVPPENVVAGTLALMVYTDEPCNFVRFHQGTFPSDQAAVERDVDKLKARYQPDAHFLWIFPEGIYEYTNRFDFVTRHGARRGAVNLTTSVVRFY